MIKGLDLEKIESQKIEKYLFLLFIAAAIIIIVPLGNSVTGMLTMQSLYCEDGDCKAFCHTDAECPEFDKVCCARNGFGVCDDVAKCIVRYDATPDSPFSNSSVSLRLSSADGTPQVRQSIPVWSYVVIVLVLIIAFLIYRKLRALEKKISSISKTNRSSIKKKKNKDNKDNKDRKKKRQKKE